MNNQIITAGSTLANIAYNLGQEAGPELTPAIRASLAQASRDWDLARSAERAASTPASPAAQVTHRHDCRLCGGAGYRHEGGDCQPCDGTGTETHVAEARAASPAPVAAITELHAAIGKIIEQVSALPALFPDGCKEPGALLRHGEVMAVLFAASRAALASVPQAQAAQQPVAPTSDARLVLLLSAASGYEARHEYGRITPDQWGDVLRVCEGSLKSTPAAPVAPSEQTAAARDVLAERRRQVKVEGWTAEHDDAYVDEELRSAAIAYLQALTPHVVPTCWPWPLPWFKPSDDRRNLVKAGALILAEI